jgi:hypothetical protein
MTFVKRAQIALAKYGRDNCLKAYRLHQVLGHDSQMVGITLKLTTRQARVAVDAGAALIGKETV